MSRHRHCVTFRQTRSPRKMFFLMCFHKTIAQTTISRVMPVCCLSVRRAHGTTRLPLDIFVRNFILEFLLKFVGKFRFWLKSDTSNRSSHVDLRTFVVSRRNCDHVPCEVQETLEHRAWSILNVSIQALKRYRLHISPLSSR